MSYVVMFRGRRACPCLAEWIPVLEREAVRLGIIRKNVDIAQLIGGAPQSGGTHVSGGAADFWQTSLAFIRLCRDMGADAGWKRPKNWDGRGGVQHGHVVLRGCPHNGPARYQITSTAYGVDHGRNGLANRGRDDGPKPLSKRTFREGIAWAKARQKKAADAAKPKPKPTPKPKPKPTPVAVPPLLFQTEAYTWNVNGKNAASIPRRAKIMGDELDKSHPSILMLQECYIGVQALIKRQLPGYLHFAGSHMGKAMWIDPRVWSFRRDEIETFALGNGKNGMAVLLNHRDTGFDMVASTAHLVVGADRSADRMAEAKRWDQLLVKFYDDTPKLLGADWNDHRITSGGPRRQLILRHGYHAAESDVRVENIVHGEVNTYNGYAARNPEDGEHIDGIVLTDELVATRVRIDDHPHPQAADHFGVEVRFGPRA